MSERAEVLPGSTEAEIASQPACWQRAAELAAGPAAALLPAAGERVAVVGCGTSWFIAQSYAAAREAAGHGETDAFAASEMPRRASLRPGARAVPLGHHDRDPAAAGQLGGTVRTRG